MKICYNIKMKTMVKIYKDLLPEEDRLSALELLKMYPDSILTQSVCTDEGVYQLRDALPITIAKNIYSIHDRIFARMSTDFELEKDEIQLRRPTYLQQDSNEFITVDKRIPGMHLPLHRDVPTGTYAGHFGLDNGMTAITMTGIFYWNDDYEGGELQFDDLTLDSSIKNDDNRFDNSILKPPFLYKPAAGDFVVFPSHLYHEILPIKNGDRFSTQYFFNRTKEYNVEILPPIHPRALPKQD